MTHQTLDALPDALRTRFSVYIGQGWPCAAWMTWLSAHGWLSVRYYGVKFGRFYFGLLVFQRDKTR